MAIWALGGEVSMEEGGHWALVVKNRQLVTAIKGLQPEEGTGERGEGTWDGLLTLMERSVS